MKKKILIAEDEEIIRQSLAKALEFNDYKVYSAPDGAKALELAKIYKPDLIISDIMMPILNGKQLLDEIQKDSELNHIPFLFLTALSDRADIRRGMQLGADDYITKPFDISELINAVNTRFAKQENTQKVQTKKINNLISNINRALPHEFRTPISIILGFSDFILKKAETIDKNELKNMVLNIREAGLRLSTLFEQYLFYASLETVGTNSFDRERLLSKRTISIETIISDLVNLLSITSDRKNDFELNIDDCSVAVGEDYFVKIMQEVIENAIKFSEKGTKITIKSIHDKFDCLISIEDFGRGMSKEQLTNIGPYIQFDRGIYEQQGAGLGLAIMNKICELHNGKMAIQSELNKFTCVKFRLPLYKQ